MPLSMGMGLCLRLAGQISQQLCPTDSAGLFGATRFIRIIPCLGRCMALPSAINPP